MRRWRIVLVLALGCLSVTPLPAHDFSIVDVLLVVKTDGTYVADLTLDLDAMALGAAPGESSAALAGEIAAMSPAAQAAVIAQLEETLTRRVRIRFDGAAQDPLVTFPDFDAPQLAAPGVPSVIGTTARLAGRIPAGAATVSFSASRALGPVQLTILEQPNAAGTRYVLAPGEESAPHALGQDAPAERRSGTGLRYLMLGFTHILPKGLDHVLFVLGLYLSTTRLKPLLWQVTAFTVAHSITLALAIYGVVSLPARLVETAIALSIAYVALENLAKARVPAWRPALVFAFGLLHGLGFAGVLRELGLPAGDFAKALVLFNVGVELGQLAVILLAAVLVGRWRGRPWYRKRIVVPASIGIGILGLYWAIERTF